MVLHEGTAKFKADRWKRENRNGRQERPIITIMLVDIEICCDRISLDFALFMYESFERKCVQ